MKKISRTIRRLVPELCLARSCSYLLIAALTLAPLPLPAQPGAPLELHADLAVLPNEAALWWMNSVYERSLAGSGSVRDVLYRNANGNGEWVEYGHLAIDSQEAIELIDAGGRVPFEGRDVLAVEGVFTDPGGASSPVAALVVVDGRGVFDSLVPVAAENSAARVSEILSMVIATLVGEPIEPKVPDNGPPPDLGGGGEECIELCNSQQILDYAACSASLAVCANAAVAAWSACALSCPMSGPLALQCELGCLAVFAIAEGVCIANHAICTNHADDTRDLCIANCCVLWDPEEG